MHSFTPHSSSPTPRVRRFCSSSSAWTCSTSGRPYSPAAGGASCLAAPRPARRVTERTRVTVRTPGLSRRRSARTRGYGRNDYLLLCVCTAPTPLVATGNQSECGRYLCLFTRDGPVLGPSPPYKCRSFRRLPHCRLASAPPPPRSAAYTASSKERCQSLVFGFAR